MTDYKKKAAREKLEREYKAKRDECRALARAWGNIERLRKKDGGDFANFRKNFGKKEVNDCGFRITDPDYGLEYHRRIEVWARAESGSLAESWINTYAVYRYMKKDEIKHDPEEKISCLEQFYAYTLDEIEEQIQKEIEGCGKKAAEMDKKLQELDNKLEKCDQIIDAVRQAVIDYQLPTEYILESLRM